jgi:hypothetical protein
MGFNRGSRGEHCDRCKARIETAETSGLEAADRALLLRLVDAARTTAED